MKRRRFIGIIGIGSVAVATGGYISFSSFEKSIERVIMNGTRDLKVEKKEIAAFLEGADKAGLWNSYSFRKREVIKWFSLFEDWGIPLPPHEGYSWYKKEIIRHFLFATNFFYDGMDTDKPVTYTQIYNPYFKPCCNPFSNLYFSN